MMDLFRSEWRRVQRIALGIAVAHLIALGLLSRAVDVTELGSQDQVALLTAYVVMAMALAVLQVGSYRQAGRWLWLIHRPLHPRRIFAALALAGAASMTVTIVIPLVIFLAAIDLLTTHVVDARHYGTIIHAFAFAMMAWLAAAHACTSRHKTALAILLPPLMLALKPASVWSLLPMVLACLVWLALVTRHGFRANRDTPLASNVALLLTAVPLQLAFFFLIFQLTKGGIALGAVVSRGTSARTVKSTDAMADIEVHLRRIGLEAWTDALAPSTDPRAPQWRAGLQQARLTGLAPDIERFPVRHQLGNVERPWWDNRRSVKWTFSHDEMMYHGRSPGTGESRGWWGEGGYSSREPFTEVPMGAMTKTSLYAVSRDTLRQRELVRLARGEWFVGSPVRSQDRVFLLTNRRLYSYWLPRDTLAAPGPKLEWNMPLEDRGLRPMTVDIAEFPGSSLVSLFYFDDWEYDGFEYLLRPWQRVFHVDGAGRATLVSERKDIRNRQVNIGVQSAVPVVSWWVSPPMYLLAHLPDLFETGLTQPPRVELVPRERILILAALVLMLVSIVGAWLWLREAVVTAARRRLWLVLCAVIGAPALLSLISLQPRSSSRGSH